jgi:hypothetical protein
MRGVQEEILAERLQFSNFAAERPQNIALLPFAARPLPVLHCLVLPSRNT